MNQQQSNCRGHFYSILLALIIGLIGTFWSLRHPRTEQPEQPSLPQAGEGLTVYLLPAGEGQCVLATCGGDTLLLDAGDETFGQTAADFLRSQKVRRIDLLVSSRPDEAYSGGLAAVVQNFPVKHVWSAVESDAGEGFTAFLAALSAAGQRAALPAEGEAFSLGDARVEVFFTDHITNALMLNLTYGETVCAIGGTSDREAFSLRPSSETDVTVYVSDGEEIVCLTDTGN